MELSPPIEEFREQSIAMQCPNHHACEGKGMECDLDCDHGEEPVPTELLPLLSRCLLRAVEKGIISDRQRARLLESVPVAPKKNNVIQDIFKISEAMKDVATGVRIGRKKRHLRYYHSVFIGAQAVDWMLEHGHVTSRSEAVRIGQLMVSQGVFHHIKGRRNFEDGYVMYRFKLHRPSFSITSCPCCPSLMAAILRLIYSFQNNTVHNWVKYATVREMERTYPAVLLWARAHPDMRSKMNQKIGDLASNPRLRMAMISFSKSNGDCLGSRFDVQLTPHELATVRMVSTGPLAKVVRTFVEEKRQIIHPFTGKLVNEIELVKQFPSSARPVWLRFKDSVGAPMPDVIAKVGDDLRKDLAVQLVFRACEAIWGASGARWRLGVRPFVRTYKVLVTSPNSGYIQFVAGKTVKEVEAKGEWDEVNLLEFLPSAVGTLVAGFIMGVRDRHSENWMLVTDRHKQELMQIDFGYMLMEAPGGLSLDTPRLTVQPSLVRVLKSQKGLDGKTTLLEDFQADLVTAYATLREHHQALVAFAKVVLSNVYDPEKVEKFMWGSHSFRSSKDERKTLHWFEDKVMSQISEFSWRRGAKHALVKAYYAWKKLT